MAQLNELSCEPLFYHQRRRCPHCTALSHLTHSLLDPCNGNTVHVYQCPGCGKRIWDQRPKLLVRS